ncbi:hypothetical protein FJQ54_06845 [Sandaracinobacter neustonicus]|uniref:Lipoprotein n=1 Tax=Sandaracinobacter neustonicus TaxID=1715348 RepID=A0A501XNJ7_9SPHN|nr:hypothetical protein [Sandaracinobacter neustonicus]TPE62241.1 hypothetical protein FJQ54_06845 [Sandaracinobacter neustonicus]
MISRAGLLLIALALTACSPKQVVTAPVQAVGQVAGSAARVAVPAAASVAVGGVTAVPAAGVAAGRAASGVASRRDGDTVDEQSEEGAAAETPQ